MFIINIKVKDCKIYAEILDKEKECKNELFEYAFYLIRNNKRINERWYEKENKTKFDIEIKDSIYYIKGFARSLDKSKKFVIDSRLVNTIIENNDSEFQDIEKNTEDDYLKFFSNGYNIKNGIYSIDVSGTNIDFLFDGLEKLVEEKGILVCFSGAISNRSSKKPPFFSGKNIARKMGMPLIAISDPSLAVNDESNLTWYAGNERLVDLSNKIASILDSLTKHLKTDLILFGGSAGGFATLSIVQKMNSKSKGVVWNSQTSISRYKRIPVCKYIESCFPKFPIFQDLYKSLENTGITHDLLKLYSEKNLRTDSILYMQNLGDIYHVENHALPFIKSLNAKKENNSTYSTNHGVTFWLNDWGNGHISPDEYLIIKILTKLVDGNKPLNIALDL